MLKDDKKKREELRKFFKQAMAPGSISGGILRSYTPGRETLGNHLAGNKLVIHKLINYIDRLVHGDEVNLDEMFKFLETIGATDENQEFIENPRIEPIKWFNKLKGKTARLNIVEDTIEDKP